MPKVITNIKDSGYSLANYNLNPGSVKAIAMALNLYRERLTNLSLSNNLLKDEDFAFLLSHLKAEG